MQSTLIIKVFPMHTKLLESGIEHTLADSLTVCVDLTVKHFVTAMPHRFLNRFKRRSRNTHVFVLLLSYTIVYSKKSQEEVIGVVQQVIPMNHVQTKPCIKSSLNNGFLSTNRSNLEELSILHAIFWETGFQVKIVH